MTDVTLDNDHVNHSVRGADGGTRSDLPGSLHQDHQRPSPRWPGRRTINRALTWLGASEKLQQAVPRVGPEATRGCRGLLLYIAGVWLHVGAQDETQRARARQLIREAALAANRGTWLKEMRDLPGAEEAPLAPTDVVAVNAIVERLHGQLRPSRVSDDLTAMRDTLAQDDATMYERGLTTLGSFLGAEASKPKGQGRCDSAWVWGSAMWMTVEAKSEEHSDGLLPLKDVRQANTQLDQLAADRGTDHPPAGSPAIIVSDRLTVDPQHAPAANPNVYLTATGVVEEIAGDVLTVWIDLLTTAVGIPSEQAQRQHFRSVMTENGCLPSQVIDRLKSDPDPSRRLSHRNNPAPICRVKA